MKFKSGWVKSTKKQGESTSGSTAGSWVKSNGIFYIEFGQEINTDLTEPALDQLGGVEPGKVLSSRRMNLCGLSLRGVLDCSIKCWCCCSGCLCCINCCGCCWWWDGGCGRGRVGDNHPCPYSVVWNNEVGLGHSRWFHLSWFRNFLLCFPSSRTYESRH